MENNKVTKQVKKLTISKKFTRQFKGYKIVPEIKFSGQWIQDLGFEVGEKIIVIYENGRVLLKTSKPIKVTL